MISRMGAGQEILLWHYHDKGDSNKNCRNISDIYIYICISGFNSNESAGSIPCPPFFNDIISLISFVN